MTGRETSIRNRRDEVRGAHRDALAELHLTHRLMLGKVEDGKLKLDVVNAFQKERNGKGQLFTQTSRILEGEINSSEFNERTISVLETLEGVQADLLELNREYRKKIPGKQMVAGR